MGNAIFKIRLRRRDFVIALKDELTVLNIVNRIGPVIFRIINAATRATAPAPLICEDDFGSVIIKSRRMPIGKALIDDFVYARWFKWIGNIENNSIS